MSALYANETSVLERVILSLVWNFKSITEAAGYRNTVGDVFTEIPGDGDIKNFPAIAFVRGQSAVPSTTHDHVHEVIPFTGMAYCRSASDPTKARLTLRQDIQKMLGSNWMLKGEDEVETCRLATWDGDRPFGMVMNVPQIGFAFGFSVTIAQQADDPSVGS